MIRSLIVGIEDGFDPVENKLRLLGAVHRTELDSLRSCEIDLSVTGPQINHFVVISLLDIPDFSDNDNKRSVIRAALSAHKHGIILLCGRDMELLEKTASRFTEYGRRGTISCKRTLVADYDVHLDKLNFGCVVREDGLTEASIVLRQDG